MKLARNRSLIRAKPVSDTLSSTISLPGNDFAGVAGMEKTCMTLGFRQNTVFRKTQLLTFSAW
ncbi:hypothetical protein GMSM_31040 [Geomonas sp. Red276]